MYETPELDSDTFVRTHEIRVHEDDEAWEGMRAAGRLVGQALDMITPFVVPGAQNVLAALPVGFVTLLDRVNPGFVFQLVGPNLFIAAPELSAR